MGNNQPHVIIIPFNADAFNINPDDIVLLQGMLYSILLEDESIIFETIDCITDDVYEEQKNLDTETDRLINLARDHYSALYMEVVPLIDKVVTTDMEIENLIINKNRIELLVNTT